MHTTFGELASRGQLEFSDGYRTKGSEYAKEGFRIIRAGDVMDSTLSFSGPDFVGASRESAIGTKVVRAGDVVLTTKGTVGRTALVKAVSEPAVYSPQLCYFRPAQDRIDPRYLFHWFSSPEFVHQSSSMKSSTDMAPYISLSQLAETRITLPPLPEQQAIAEVLGALDDKIAANRSLINGLDELSKLLYQSRTTGLPRVGLSELINPTSGGTPKRDVSSYWDGNVPWISVRDVVTATAGAIIHASETISPEGSASSAAKVAPAGTVILTARGTVGEVARLTMDGTFNQSCYGFIPRDIPSAVLFHLVRDGAQTARQVAHGSVFSTITTKTMSALEVPHLSQELMTNLEAQLAPLHDQIDAACHESATLATLRDTLLPALMDGRLRVKDAERTVSAAL